MTDAELREMVRSSIAKIAGAAPDVPAPPFPSTGGSFARLALLRSGDDEGACLIEPSVRCNHCGYCLSYGH